MKISPLSLLLATTFLTSSAFALTADEFGTSSNVDWKEVSAEGDNTVSVETPEGYKIFQYTYTPNGRTVYNEKLQNTSDSINADFVNINGGSFGGNAIYNESTDITSITGDFIGNNADHLAKNGFIYNSSNIQNIKGDFISNIVYGNYGVSGAGITNGGYIENIEGDFIGNRANIDRTTHYNAAYGYDTFGGAIYNSNTITNIAGNFIGNLIYYNTFSSTYGGGYLSSYGGAIANDYGNIETITGDAIGNYIQTNGYGYGGFLYNQSYNPNAGPCSIAISLMSDNSFYNIGSINGNIISNHVMAYNGAYGGAISNSTYGSIAEINAEDISYNYAIYDYSFAQPASIQPADYDPFGEYYSGNAYGGAIYNEGTIGQINANISNNYAGAGYAIGGAILNESIIQSINGNISSNYAISAYTSLGGAIYTSSTYSTVYIGDITGDIVGNYAISQEEARGGFLYQIRQRIERIDEYSAQIGNIIGNIEKNYAAGNYYADGGAIYNYWSVIENITGNISNNYVYSSDGYATGGAISNNGGKIGNITGDFTKNYAYGYNEALGGAIYNVDYDWLDTGVGIDNISGSFVGNYAKSEGYAFGGAIFNEGGDLTFAAKGEDYKISGNYTQDRRGKINNAIWMQNSEYHGPELPANLEPESVNISLLNNSNYEPFIPSLNFKVTKNGSYTIDDQIDGGYYYGMVGYDNSDYEPVERYGYGYNLNISGDACPQCEWNSVRFNNLVNNVNNLTVTKTQMALGKDAVVNVVNNYIAKSNPYIRLDLDAMNEKVGQLNIGGEVIGTTSVIVNVLKNKEISEENSIVFATAQNHSLSEEEAQKSFKVYRVVGSPFMWAVSYNDINKTWGLYSTSEENTYTEDCVKPEEPETPEVFDGFMPTLDRIKEGIQIVDYISDIEALPNSAFAYQEATSGDNSFSFTDTNAYGTETDKSYKIVLKPEEFSTSSDLTFTADDNGSIEVQLPNGETQYFSYEYTGDESDAFIGLSYENEDFAEGGAIYDITEFDSNIINADFIENYVSSSDGAAVGGAIYNDDNTIGDITGDFISNYAEGMMVAGGAIMNGYNSENSNIGSITGSFIGNYGYGIDVAYGTIANAGIVGDITGDFIANYAESESGDAFGGAIYSFNELGNITGDFIANHVKSNDGYVSGGAILNNGGVIGDITGDFIGNYAEGYEADGGAISNCGDIGSINGSFINNYVKVIGEDEIGYGGAITTYNRDLTFKTEGTNNRFSGNYVENADGSKVNNAIFVYNDYENGAVSLNFEVGNNGSITFDDEIDGGHAESIYDDEGNYAGSEIIRDGYGYNVNIYGDVCPQCIVNSVIFNSKVKNVYNLTIDTTQMVLGKDAHIEIVNDYIAQNNPYLRLNVDAVNGKTGQLEIGGQVIGTTQVIANIINYKDVRGEESIVFATAENDTTGGEESFKIFRTVGSPYKWYVDYDETAKTWGLAMGEETNDYEEDCYPKPEPNPEPTPQPLGPIEVEPEVIAMEALPTAAIAQTNGMIYNIMRKVSINRLYCPGCGFYDYNWNGEPFHNVWVDTIYNGLTIEAPVEIDAKVWGIEAGADIQKDLNNKLGVFVSYRQGNYEMDGKGDKYFAKLGSELDIDSYLAGLYYRYDYNNWYAFATLYGGMQNAEIQTDDGVSADTDGLEFGGSAEIGYSHALNKTVYITPSLGVFYSQISYDDASDDYGKTVEYGDLKQVELEAGLKLSKAVYTDNGTASVYVKPSVVQTLVDGDEINITEIGKVDTIEDKTLGRIEIGGSYGFNDNWSAYGWANYTFGSDYEATSLGAGVNYAW